MKNYIKIIITFILIILLTGCSGNYNLNINADLSIEENLELTIDNENDAYDKTVKIFEDNKIDEDKYDINIESDEIKISYKDKYSSIEDYILNSKVYNQLYETIEYNKSLDYIDLYTSGYIKMNDNFNKINGSNLTDFDVIQVNIKNPYKIDITNAEMVNDNVYTWSLTKENNNNTIHMKFKPSFNSFPYRPVIVGSILLILTLVFVIRIYRRFKNTQRI